MFVYFILLHRLEEVREVEPVYILLYFLFYFFLNFIYLDGLAFWYTRTPGIEGPVFGSVDKWTGLGIFFDTYDNDNRRLDFIFKSIIFYFSFTVF